MRKLSLLTLILLTSSTYYVPPRVEIIEIPTKEVTFEVESEVELELAPVELRNLDELVEALIWVESRGNDSAFHKGENAVGCLQIRPIMVEEVNRVLDLQGLDNIYTLEDRWSRTKSIEMFNVIADYYHETSSYEKIARCWNGGPKGLQKKQTKKYWRKVQKRLNYNENSADRESEV
jgi:hypothetical protein